MDGIYEDSEEFNLQEISSAQPDTQTAMRAKERNPKTGPPPLPSGAAGRCCRWTAVCLGLLCALLLGLSIRLTVWLLTERHQLLTNHSNLLKERDQLLRYKLCYEGVDSCPNGWEVFECNCYHNKQHVKNWSDSRRYCQSLGGDLVLIKTPEKQRFITEKQYAGWIGLRKGEKNGSWGWIDDTPVSTWYWYGGQPNNASTDCVVIHQSDTTYKTWHDYVCDSIGHWAICEKPALSEN
ncbi:hypothetical protein ACEWY4_022836 [Coilia grayii]|uniref:C-type lectin domain-containing protein n=1 Tax=Coilia grayii TaxID=363190 RepID=A0ABD1J1A0_9TELE